MNDNRSNGTGLTIGALSILLFIVFLILRFVGVIDWDWLWIFSPLWIPPVLGFSIFILLALVLFFAHLVVKAVEKIKNRK